MNYFDHFVPCNSSSNQIGVMYKILQIFCICKQANRVCLFRFYVSKAGDTLLPNYLNNIPVLKSTDRKALANLPLIDNVIDKVKYLSITSFASKYPKPTANCNGSSDQQLFCIVSDSVIILQLFFISLRLSLDYEYGVINP